MRWSIGGGGEPLGDVGDEIFLHPQLHRKSHDVITGMRIAEIAGDFGDDFERRTVV